jgi:hypothetical protein
VVGAHHGFEPQKYKEHGVDVVSIDVVRSFVEDCRELGLETIHSSIEELEPVKVDGVHASHVLEHTWNIVKAVEVIKECAQSWCYVASPYHPPGFKVGKSDLSPIRHKMVIVELFKPWKADILYTDKTSINILFTKV